MTLRTVGTADLDYLQRTASEPAPIDGALATVPGERRRIVRIRSVGRTSKKPRDDAHTHDPRRPFRVGSEDLVIGASGAQIPLLFAVEGDHQGTAVRLGTWTNRDDGRAAGVVTRRMGVLTSVLQGQHTAVDAVDDDPGRPATWPLSGLVLGTPTAKPPLPGDPTVPLDRVIRAMAGCRWAAQVVAYPVPDAAIAAVRNAVVNEVRKVESAARAEGAPTPLAEQYVELLKESLRSLTEAAATGGWRVAVQLLGDAESYPRLASVWRSVFSGERSRPEAVRVFDRPEAVTLAAGWGMTTQPPAPGPSGFCRPFEHETLLSSPELAAYVHLPTTEVPGFAVEEVPAFDVVVPPSTGPTIRLGPVVHRARETTEAYRVPLASLDRHVFIAGLTGSGKTNTLFHLLQEADAAGVPFLVLEPAKAEYRTLARTGFGDRLRVFTLGSEAVSPFRLNPFEVTPGIPVAVHLDLLRAVFASAFALWAPLPQVFERCVQEIYADRGWDLGSGTNHRIGGSSEASGAGGASAAGVVGSVWPTLTDLAAKVRELVPQLGYSDESEREIQAALLTRVDSLRTGAKGLMLDVDRSLPMDDLLAGPAVLELEGLGDDDDKAFLMGLLLVRLYEHRRVEGPADGLRHLLVVEEAHRLLTEVPAAASSREANPKGKLVETFTQMLSEIRAYGQGMVIADQVPVRLAADVIKNTNLKVIHRLVSRDDREAVAGAMAMSPEQATALASLPPGRAAVFAGGDDTPVLVQVPARKGAGHAGPPTDAEVAEHMGPFRAARADLFLATGSCRTVCHDHPLACQWARRVLGEPRLQRIVRRVGHTTLETPAALPALWQEVVTVVRASRPAWLGSDAALAAVAVHAGAWFAERSGAVLAWPYTSTAAFGAALSDVLLRQVAGTDAAGHTDAGRVIGPPGAEAVRRLQALAGDLFVRDEDPFPGCSRICGPAPGRCAYRAAVADQADDASAWAAGIRSDDDLVDRWDDALLAADEVIDLGDDAWPETDRELVEAAHRRAALCHAQHALDRSSRRISGAARDLAALLSHATADPPG